MKEIEKMNKDKKDVFFKLRLTKSEKEKLQAYADKHNMTMTEAIRQLCYKIFEMED